MAHGVLKYGMLPRLTTHRQIAMRVWTSVIRTGQKGRMSCVGQRQLRFMCTAAKEGEEKPKDTTPTSEETTSEDLKAKAVKLQQELESSQLKVKENNDKYLRALAEMENVRRRATKDVDIAKKFALQNFAKSLLDVADNLTRASDSVPKEMRTSSEEAHQHVKSLYEGVTMVERQLQTIFKTHAITQFAPSEGDGFNPNLHEATFEVPSPESAGTVAACTRTGYMYHERVLRPAEVGVHKKIPTGE